MLCRQNIHIFLKIFEILLRLCKRYTKGSAKIRGGDCNIPKDEPYCNNVYGLLIMFCRLVIRVLISW
jgi:hypothetical protein